MNAEKSSPQGKSLRGANQPGGNWKASLAAVLKQYNGTKNGGSVASYATQDKRADVLFAGFAELRELGYRLETVESFRGKHVEALVQSWQQRELSASTVQNNLSILRTFAGWIGKAGMVQSKDHYLGPEVARRTSIATEDKSWSAKSIDIWRKIEEVRCIDPGVAIQLELEVVFGLRAREAMQLRPVLADKGTFLAITVGAKGGRARVVAIDTPQKRDVLDRAKTLAATRSSSTSDPHRTLSQWKNHYYQVVRSCGITQNDGITSHGLRHHFANDQYRTLTGVDSPVRDPSQHVDRETDQAARLMIADELGHSRESITTHYLGR